MNGLLLALGNLSRPQKRALQIAADSILVSVSFALAMFLRLDHWAWADNPRVWLALLILVPSSLLLFFTLGFYREVVRYLAAKAYKVILAGVVVSGILLLVGSQVAGLPVPRSVPFIYMLLALVTVGGARLLLRGFFARRSLKQKRRVVIYGCGEAGRQLVGTLNAGADFLPIAFLDDNPAIQKTRVMGLPVHSPGDLQRLIADYGVTIVLLALPSASLALRKAILTKLEAFEIEVRTVPGMVDIVSGRATFSELREVTIEDLLGRDPVPPDPELLDQNIRDKIVLVTGAGGSIGSELCRQVLDQKPKKILLLEVSEYALYSIQRELDSKNIGSNVEVIPLLGSVQNRPLVKAIFAKFSVDTVFHAAAYKHVPLVEHNVIEGVTNNVCGTLNLVHAAVDAGAGAFILISTDKAVRPTNVMGASKRMAELVCQAYAERAGRTVISMVRFGNVLGSSGSVVPLFREQIRSGGPITVTDREMTRYFMTIFEAAQLVIQAGAMARGGDVFLLSMGEPVRILDLAMRMARLSGLRPIIAGEEDGHEHDIEISLTGLRPGEKIHEELLVGESSETTRHPRIMRAQEVFVPWDELAPLVASLEEACRIRDHKAISDILRHAPLGYVPMDKFVDPLADQVWITTGEREAASVGAGQAAIPSAPLRIAER